jgi:hypothetical protein
MSRVLLCYFRATYVDGRVLGLRFVMSIRIYLSWIKGYSKDKSPKVEGLIYFNGFTKPIWSL